MPLTVKAYFHISEISQILADCKVDNDCVFIVPSGLDKEPMLRLAANGGSFFGARPKIWTINDLYNELTDIDGHKGRRVVDPPDHNLIVKYLLDNFINEMDAKNVELPAGVRYEGFADVLGENIRDLLLEEVPCDKLGKLLCEDVARAENEPQSILWRLYGDYVDYLGAQKLADSAQVPGLARALVNTSSKVGEFVRSHRFVIVGFLTFNGGQRKLVSALGEIAAECLFVLPETGLQFQQDSLAQVIDMGGRYEKRPEWNEAVMELDANNARLEFESIARELALWTGGKSELGKLGGLGDYGEVGLMTSPQRLRLVENALNRYKIPFNEQVRGTAGDTIFGELPVLLWEAYASGWDYGAALKFLKSPLLSCDYRNGAKKLGGNTGVFASLASCSFDLSKAAEIQPCGLEEWKNFLETSGAADCRRLAAALEAADSLCEQYRANPLTPAAALSLWRDFVMGLDILPRLAAYVDESFEFDPVVKDISSALTELDKKCAALNDLSRDIGEAGKVTLSGAEIIRYIRGWADTATLPIPLPQSHSVTIYAGNPPVLASHRYWFMTDVDYNSWPGKLRESPLLPNEGKLILNAELQKKPGPEGAEDAFYVPDLHDERQQKESLFRRLTAVGEAGTVIARSTTDASGRPVGRSQFAASLLDASAKAEEEKSAAAEKRGERRVWSRLGKIEYPLSRVLPKGEDVCFDEAECRLAEPQRLRWTLPLTWTLPFDDSRNTVSISSIDGFNACPFLYMCESRYGLRKRFPSLYDPAKAGDLLHKLWHDAWEQREKDRRLTFAKLSDELWDAALADKYSALASDPRLSKRQLPRLREQARSVALLMDEMDDELDGSRLKSECEYKLPELEIDGVRFKGTADRVDFYDDGVVIIDYKSNISKSHMQELQLAAYAKVLKETLGLKTLGFGWIGHRDAKLSGYFAKDSLRDAYLASSKPRQSVNERITAAEDIMTEMAQTIKKGVYPARYENKDACRTCGFQTICRRQEAPNLESLDEETGDGADE